jgi:2-polyprenyl-6-methoxyphenol hydroxylase-like FAD-dependent oxidoreductase
MSTHPSIAIIGAGPSGCTLARLLHLNKIPFTLFEGEASSSIRSQGSTLDLHSATGLAAVKACHLWDEFSKHARYDGEAMTFTDKSYRIYLQRDGSTAEDSYGRPEIDRSALRQLLVESLPADSIRWGHRVKEVQEDGTIEFLNASTAGPST